MNAVDYINYGHDNAVTRKRLVELTGMNDREVREDIRLASINGELILNLQDGKGYFKPNDNETHLIRYWINLNKSRVKEEMTRIAAAERYLNV